MFTDEFFQPFPRAARLRLWCGRLRPLHAVSSFSPQALSLIGWSPERIRRLTHVCRVAGQCHHCPAPSEPCWPLTKHTAQASPCPSSLAQIVNVPLGHSAPWSVSWVRLLSLRLA